MKPTLIATLAIAFSACATTSTTTGKDGSVTVVTRSADNKAVLTDATVLTGLALQVWLATHPVVTNAQPAAVPAK